MKTNILSIISAILLTVSLSSCQSKEERVINKFEKLSERVEKEGQHFTADEWELALKEYETLHEEAGECDFTREQLEELGRVDGRLTAIMAKEGAKRIGSEMSNFLENGKTFMKGFMEGVRQGMESEE